MISVDTALRIILKNVAAPETEKIKLPSALNRILAEEIIAPDPFPSFTCSSIDGFAVRASELQHLTGKDTVTLTVAGVSGPGNPFDAETKKGESVQVMTGAMIPKGLDSVVPMDDVIARDDEKATFSASVERGLNIKKTGEEIRKGDRVLREGALLTPPAIGMLATFGYTKLKVYETPTVNIMATGDELVDYDVVVQPGQVRNSTSPALAAYVQSDGGIPTLVGIAPDRKKKIRRKIAEGLDGDLLVITGGSSVGKFDYVRKTLQDIDAEILFSNVNMKPGRPALFGRVGTVPVFGLPGNPVSTIITYLQFVRPAMHILSGRTYTPPFSLRARLEHEMVNPEGRRHYVAASVEQRDGAMYVKSAGAQNPYAMTSLLKANCLMILHESVKHFKKHSEVKIEML